jgi:two-component system, LuxR family, sensor kinase FixL
MARLSEIYQPTPFVTAARGVRPRQIEFFRRSWSASSSFERLGVKIFSEWEKTSAGGRLRCRKKPQCDAKVAPESHGVKNVTPEETTALLNDSQKAGKIKYCKGAISFGKIAFPLVYHFMALPSFLNSISHKPAAAVDEREVLDRVGQAVLNHMWLKPLIQEILNVVLPLGPFDLGRVRLLDQRTNATMVAGTVGCQWTRESEETTREPLLRVIREAIQDGSRARVIDDVASFPGLRTAKNEHLKTAVFLPICDVGEALGCIVLGSRAPLKIEPARLRLLEAIANHVGIGIKKARLFEETSRNFERIRALHDINLAVTSTLEIDAVLETLLEKLDESLPFAIAATVRMFNKETGQSELLACRNIAWERCVKAFPDGRTGLGSLVIEYRAPLAVANALHHPSTKNRGFFAENGLVSYLGLPLIAKEELLGIIAIFTREEREFGDEEIEFLTAAATHAATAIYHSRLYREANVAKEEQEKANRRLSQILRQTTGLYAALAPLGASESPDEMFESFIDHFCLASGADAVAFRMHDETTDTFVCAAHRGFSPGYVQMAADVDRTQHSRDVHRSGIALISPDVAADPRLRQKNQLKLGYRSCALLPFKVKGAVRGVIHLASRTLGFFNEENRERLLGLARVVEIVFENRALFDDVKSARDSLEKVNERLKARTIQQAVLNHFSHLALSSKSIPDLLEEAALEVSLVLRVDYCEVSELVTEGGRLILRAGTGWRRGHVGRAIAGDDSHAGYALAADKPIVFTDLDGETRFRGSTLLREHGVVSGMIMTIVGQERPFGIIGAYTNALRNFNEEEIHFLMSFAYILTTAFDRVRAEQRLRDSQRRYEELVESIEGIVWEADARTFQVTYMSPQAERILGYSPAAWLDDPGFWTERIHPQDRRWALAFCRKATLEMRPYELECRMTAADGRLVWMRSIVTVVTEHDRPVKLRGVALDITERRRMEREISEISERERQRIGRDLHDELGQILTGIACISAGLSQELDRGGRAEGATAAQIADLTNQALTQTRSLARGLYPVELEANGLFSALNELAANAETLFGITCRASYDAGVSEPADEIAIQLYRIAQEAIDNAVRHGKARHVWIRLADQGDLSFMSVVDDGAGLAERRGHKGMGLRIMKHRAGMIGGILEIRKGQDGGTTVECSFRRRTVSEGKIDGQRSDDQKKIHSIGG